MIEEQHYGRKCPKFHEDDGTEVNPGLIPEPDLCISCRKDKLGEEEAIFCTLTRMAQQGEVEFTQCGIGLKEA